MCARETLDDLFGGGGGGRVGAAASFYAILLLRSSTHPLRARGRRRGGRADGRANKNGKTSRIGVVKRRGALPANRARARYSRCDATHCRRGYAGGTRAKNYARVTRPPRPKRGPRPSSRRRKKFPVTCPPPRRCEPLRAGLLSAQHDVSVVLLHRVDIRVLRTNFRFFRL